MTDRERFTRSSRPRCEAGLAPKRWRVTSQLLWRIGRTETEGT